VGRKRKLLERILSARSDANIPFEQTRTLLKSLGFSEDTEGDHFIYRKEGIPVRINIQPQGAKCKPYQVRQIRKVLVDYNFEV
jgi:hypothetical protein